MRIIFSFLLFVLCSSIISCTPSPKIIWSFQTGAFVYGSPAIWKDRVIIGSNDHHLYALKLEDGSQIWKVNLGERIISRPLIDGDSAYIGVGNGYFYSINPSDGSIRWKFKTNDLIDYDACADDAGIYFGSNDAHFYKLSRSGEKLWDYASNNRFWGTCVFHKNLVFTSSWDMNYYGIERSTGAVAWKVNTGVYNYGGPFLSGDSVFFATHKQLYRVDAATGKILSFVKVSYLDHPVVYDGFLWTNERGLIKRTLDGAEVGKIVFNSNRSFKPVIGPGYLIVSFNASGLKAVSTDLKVVWEYEGEDSFWSPGVIHNGVYYTGNRDTKVYALRLPR